MSYELHVNASVAGQQQLEQLTRGTDAQSASSKKLNEALYGVEGATKKLTEAQLKYQTQLAKTEEWTLRYRTAQLDANRAADTGTQSIKRLGNAHAQSVSQIQAVGGALRTLEGAMPIRAAERFLTMIPGIGTALQAAFPIFGAVAFTEVMGRMVTKAGELYNAWDPIVKAQKESLRLMEESDKKYDSLISKSNSLRLDQYERDHGRTSRLRLEATEASGDAAYDDAARIRYIQEQLDNQRRLAAVRPGGLRGANPADIAFAKEHGLPTAAGASGALIPGLQAQLEEAQFQQKVDQQRASDLAAKAREADIKRDKPSDDLMRRSQEIYAKAVFGTSTPQGVYRAESARIEFERADALKSAREKHESGSDLKTINQAFDLQKIAAFVTYLEKAGEGLRRLELELPPSDSAEGRQEKIDRDRGLRTVFMNGRGGALNPTLFGVGATPLPTPGYVSPEEQLRIARDQTRRQSGLFSVQAGLAGLSPGERAQGTFGIQMQGAQNEYEALVRNANLKLRADEAEKARLDALADLKEKQFDAEMQREQSLLEIALKQKEEFQGFAAGLAGAAMHGGGRGVASFARGQLDSMMERVIGNAAGMAWGSLAKIIPHAAAGTSLGKVLQGTVFGPDATKVATAANTTATAQNTAATMELTRALAMSRSGGGGGRPSGSAGSGGWDGGTGIGSGDPGSYGVSSTTLSPDVISIPSDPNSPVSNDPGGPYSNVSGGGIGKLGKAVGIAAGGFGVFHGVKDITSGGGAGRTIGGIGQVAAGVGSVLSALSPALAMAGPIGAIAGLGLGLVSSFFGDPKANRQKQIAKQLETSQFLPEVAINASMSTNGGYSDFDRSGNVRTSNLSPFPSVQQGYFDYRYHTTVPGRTVSAFGGPAAAPTVNLNISAIDNKSIVDRHADIIDALHMGLSKGSGNSEGLRNELRR